MYVGRADGYGAAADLLGTLGDLMLHRTCIAQLTYQFVFCVCGLGRAAGVSHVRPDPKGARG